MAEQPKLRVAGEKATQFVRAIGRDESLCLRETNSASTCTACLDVCPGHAIRQPKDSKVPGGTKVTISKGFCVDCGLCCEVCPTSSLIVMEPTPRYLRHLLKRAQAAAGGNERTVYLTCIETGLASEDPSVVEIPCLGALSKETWASLMLDFPNLAVYLPADLCSRCKAKVAEGMIVDAVVDAQGIVGRDLPLVELRKELEFTDSKGNLRSESDELFEGIGSGFGDIVRDFTNGDDSMTEEERGQSDMRKTRVRLRKEITVAEGEETPGLKDVDGLTGIFTVPRATILDAVMRFPQIAPQVELEGVAIDVEKCSPEDLDAVVAGCPLGAAHRTEDGGIQINPLVCVNCGLCKDILTEGAVSVQLTPIEPMLRESTPASE